LGAEPVWSIAFSVGSREELVANVPGPLPARLTITDTGKSLEIRKK